MTTDKSNPLLDGFYKARDLLPGPLDAFDTFKILLTLLAYKRVDDLLGQRNQPEDFFINIPEDSRWHLLQKQSSNCFKLLDKNLKNIFSVNKGLEKFGEIVNIAKYDEKVPFEIQNKLINIFSNLDLSDSSFSDKEITAFVNTHFELFYEDYREDFYEQDSIKGYGDGDYFQPFYNIKVPYSVSKLAIKLLNPQKGDYMYIPSCGVGDTLIAVVNHSSAQGISIVNSLKADTPTPSIRLRGNEKNKEMLMLAVLRMILSGASPDLIENDNYLSRETYDIQKGAYKTSYKADYGYVKDSDFNYLNAVDSIDDKPENLMLKLRLLKEFDFHYMQPSLIFLNLPYGFYLNCTERADGWDDRYSIPSNISYDNTEFTIPEKFGELMFLLLSLKQLKKEGRMGIVLPYKVLLAEEAYEVRKFLTEKDYIEAVVGIQSPYYSDDEKPFSIVLLILNKNKQEHTKGKVAFIQTEFLSSENEDLPEAVITDDEFNRVVNAHKAFNANSKDNYIATLIDIQQHEYNLSPEFYTGDLAKELKDLRNNNTGVKLGEIATMKKGQSHPVIKGGAVRLPYITVKELQKDVAEPFLDIKKISQEFVGSDNDHENTVNEKCILVSLVGNHLKPVMFDPEKESAIAYDDREDVSEVLLGPDVAAIVPDEGKIDLEYLYYQLYSQIVTDQLKVFSSGAASLSIALSHLRSIMIDVPDSIEEQGRLVKPQKERLLETENLRHEAFKERLKGLVKKQEAELQIVRHLAHNINPQINMIKSPIASLEWFLEERGLLDAPLSRKLDGTEETVREALQISHNTLLQVYNLLELASEYANEIKSEDFQDIDICNLFKEKIKTSFKINILCNVNNKVRLHLVSFIEAMNNIIRNAEMHAFPDGFAGSELMFRISEDNDNVIIDYMNNGRRFPKDMGEKDFLSYVIGKDSNGKGFGGAWIGKVIEAHAGKFQIIRDRHPVHFRITLPKEVPDE